MDTAQPSQAAETDPIAAAAQAFKAFDDPTANHPRGEDGKWTREAEPEEEAEEEALEADDSEDDLEADEYDDEDEQDAAEPAQPMPPSWGAEDAELWNSLPPETQSKIAAREGERDRGLNLKLQETANARKEAEAKAAEVSTKLENLSNVIETVEALYQSPEPDPRAFGYGTEQFNEPAYRMAHQQWQQTEQALAQLRQQRDATAKEVSEAEEQAFNEWKASHEENYRPKLLADVPELTDAAKAEPILRELVTYAIENGIPEDVFSEELQGHITSAQLHLMWKAQQYDKLKANKTAPKPKPAGPAVKPGVSSPRSAKKAARKARSFDRLAREGSVEAAADVFKHLGI